MATTLKDMVLIAATAAFLLSAPAAAQRASTRAGDAPKQSGAGMPESCKKMMEKHRAAAAEQRASQAKLDELVKEMKNAAGEPKINAMSRAIEELAAQRRAEMGRRDEMMAAMGECPMMEGGMMHGMTGAEGKSKGTP